MAYKKLEYWLEEKLGLDSKMKLLWISIKEKYHLIQGLTCSHSKYVYSIELNCIELKKTTSILLCFRWVLLKGLLVGLTDPILTLPFYQFLFFFYVLALFFLYKDSLLAEFHLLVDLFFNHILSKYKDSLKSFYLLKCLNC